MRSASAKSRYSYGVSDPETRAGWAAYQRELRREKAFRELEPVRLTLLALLTSGTPLPDAVKQIGRTAHTVHRWAEFFPDFADQLDRAQIAGAPPGTRHGTSNGYQRARCRCTACRTWDRERSRGSTARTQGDP